MKQAMQKLSLSLLGATVLALGSACSKTADFDGEVFRFTAIPHENQTELRQKFAPVAAYLSEKLGVKVQYVPVSDYPASVSSFENGSVQMAWFGGLSGVQARMLVPGAKAIVCGKEDKAFKSYIIAHKDSKLQKGDNFPMAAKGMSFTFGSKGSTSGRLMPEYFIREFTKQAPDEFFKSAGFSGSHDKTLKLVEEGAVQVGAVNYSTYDKRLKEGKLDADKCRIIWVTPDYFDYNITIHPEVDTAFGEGFMQKVQQALLDMKDPQLLSAFARSEMIPCSDKDFAAIKATAEALDLLPKNNQR